MNKWLGSGKVSEEPFIKYNGDKASFVAFTLMVKRSRIPDGGQPVDFIDCICTGQNARFAQQFLRKGKKVEVVGPLQSRHYTKDGKKVYTKTVLVEEINFAETKAEEEERQKQESQQPEPTPPDYSFMDIPDGIDGEFPFQ